MRSSARFDLTKLKPRLLTDLGRTKDALAVVWADFCTHPDRFSFDELMAFAPAGERLTWQEKAITAAALAHFARAQRGYTRAARLGDWQDTVVQVQTQHRRKSSFLPRFQALARDGDADDAEPKPAPSFLDRAKSRRTLPDHD